METKSFMKKSLANKSVVERVVDQITNAIINGELLPGDKLPTEPELCETFNVGRNSVREAIKILEAYGVVEIKRASGTYVRKEYNYKMLYPILYGIILQKDSKRQIIELRKVIDVGVLQEAMRKMEDKDIQLLANNVKKMQEEMEKEDPSEMKIFDLDVDFHSVLVNVLKNELLDSICYYVDKITRQTRVMTIAYILENDHQEELVELHREIIDVLKKKDESQINSIVERHYKYWEK